MRISDWSSDVCSSDLVGFEVIVGGGLGRTPYIGVTIRKFLPKQHLLSYLEAILRVYNQLGRRDNLFKSRIKILVQQTGAEAFRDLVEDEWLQINDGYLTLPTELGSASCRRSGCEYV